MTKENPIPPTFDSTSTPNKQSEYSDANPVPTDTVSQSNLKFANESYSPPQSNTTVAFDSAEGTSPNK